MKTQINLDGQSQSVFTGLRGGAFRPEGPGECTIQSVSTETESKEWGGAMVSADPQTFVWINCFSELQDGR